MQTKFYKLGGALAVAITLGLASGAGSLEPRYELANGQVTNSKFIVKRSGQAVVDISPSLGFLKLLACAGAIVAALWGIDKSYDFEIEVSEDLEVRKGQHQARLQQQQLIYEAEAAAMKPVVEAQAIQAANDKTVELAVKGQVAELPMTEIENEPPIPERYSEKAPNFTKEFGAAPKTAMIIGVPGAGKGMFTSNAVRELKARHPSLYILAIDPKDDPNETGYWEQGFNKVMRFNQENLTADALLDYVERIVESFKKIDGPKLLLFDEMTVMFRRLKDANKKAYQEIVNYLIGICSSGDSRGIYFWGVGQSANADDYGFSGGIRSVFKPVAIVSKTDIAASRALLQTKFVPTDEGIESVIQMMDYSPVGRAIYWYPEGRWYPMTELHNYSGYNRDARAVA